MDALRLPDIRLTISVFDNAWDNQPKARECTLTALVRALLTVPERPDVRDKRQLAAWSPARFAGKVRRADAVVELSCIVLDLDGGSPKAVTDTWSDVSNVLHSTWSHTSANPRFRLVVPLARPVPAELWPSVWAWATARTPEADPACKDPSRLYFRPACRSRSEPFLARYSEGALLDVLPFAAAVEQPLVRPSVPTVVPARFVNRVTYLRLAEDPGTRERVASELGMGVVGTGDDRRVEHLLCPSCGQPSVWYLVQPRRQHRAYCNHRKTCGWSGTLAALLGGGTQ